MDFLSVHSVIVYIAKLRHIAPYWLVDVLMNVKTVGYFVKLYFCKKIKE